MPLQKTIPIDSNGMVYLWEVTESEPALQTGISLAGYSKDRLAHMKSELHRRAYLSIRHLLKTAGYQDSDLWYDLHGKPHLIDGSFVSISHSFTQTALVVHKNIPVGIDVEMKREKILRIAHKFTTFVREPNTDIIAEIPRLTHIWAAKETMYKIAGTPGLSFLKDMRVFWLLNHWLIGIIQTAKQEIFYEMHPFEIGDFGGVWGLEIQKASAREGQLKEAFLEAKKNGRVY